MKDEKKTLLISIVAVVALIIIVFGATYAYFTASMDGNADDVINVTTHTTDSLVLKVSNDIVIFADMENFAPNAGNQKGDLHATAELKANSKTNNATGKYNLFFVIDENGIVYSTKDKSAELILQVTNPLGEVVKKIDGLNYVTVVDGKGESVSGFDITGRTGGFKIAKDYEISTTSSKTDDWKIEVILVNLDENQSANTGKVFSGNSLITKEDFNTYELALVNDGEFVVNSDSIDVSMDITLGTAEVKSYYYAIKKASDAVEVEESDFVEDTSAQHTFDELESSETYNVYAYAMDVYGFKSNMFMTTLTTKKSVVSLSNFCSNENLAQCIKNNYDKDENINYHSSSLTNGAGDNSYRYSGSYESVNNYVCFGYDGSDACPHDNLYRIIGVFGSQVKLIKADYAKSSELGTSGDYYGHFSDLKGDWAKNAVSKGINSKEEIGIYYWNYSSGKNSENHWAESRLNTTNLNSTFLRGFSSTWQGKIATTSWKIDGSNKLTGTPYNVYQNEITKPQNMQDMTPVSNKIGLMYVSDYGFAASPSAWTSYVSNYNAEDIKNNNWMYMGLTEWTISRLYSSLDEDCAMYINNGWVSSGVIDYYGYATRPVFYLQSTITLTGGNGTAETPYTIN